MENGESALLDGRTVSVVVRDHSHHPERDSVVLEAGDESLLTLLRTLAGRGRAVGHGSSVPTHRRRSGTVHAARTLTTTSGHGNDVGYFVMRYPERGAFDPSAVPNDIYQLYAFQGGVVGAVPSAIGVADADAHRGALAWLLNDSNCEIVVESGGAGTVSGDDDYCSNESPLTRTNQGPVANSVVVDIQATERIGFSYRVPWILFDDPDGDSLSLVATLSSTKSPGSSGYTLATVYGDDLPSWLTFDPDTRVLSGTAPANTPNLQVRIVARDRGDDGIAGNGDDGVAYVDVRIATPAVYRLVPGGSGSVSTSVSYWAGTTSSGFVVPDRLEAAGAIDWYSVLVASDSIITVDVRGSASRNGTLRDPMLRGIYRQTGGTMVLVPNSTDDDGSGTADARLTFPTGEGGRYFVAVSSADDGVGTYTLALSSNRAPVITDQNRRRAGTQGIGEVHAREGERFTYEIPDNLFTDPDGDRLTRTVRLANGDALPSWLRLHQSELRSVGNVPVCGDLDIRVTATDASGFATADTFVLHTDAPPPPPPPAPPPPSWTLMVYMAADNNLEAQAFRDINEMEEALRRNTGLRNVNIVVQIDRAQGHYTGDGNWTDTRRGRISSDRDPNAVGSRLASVGEKNMGDPTTLTEFVNWASSTYPADRYGLVIWNHGGGLAGTCWDDSAWQSGSPADCLSIAETTRAIADSRIGRLGFLGFDTCLQGMVEQAYDLRSGSGEATRTLADYVVASEDFEIDSGWNYRSWLGNVNDTFTERQWADSAVSAYSNTYRNELPLASVATDRLDELAAAVASFVDAVESDDGGISAAERLAFRSACESATTFSREGQTQYSNRDLGGVMTAISASPRLNQPIRSAAQAVTVALQDAVSSRTDNAAFSGLSIFAPRSRAEARTVSYDGSSFRFVADSRWNEFLAIMNG